MKKIIGIGILGLALSTTVGCAVRTYGHYGPPPPPHGAMVYRGRPGYVWIPRYRRWEGDHYRWIQGRWVMPPRPGMVWVPGYRERHAHGYIWVEGYWR
jgi:hypothetical protein